MAHATACPGQTATSTDGATTEPDTGTTGTATDTLGSATEVTPTTTATAPTTGDETASTTGTTDSTGSTGSTGETETTGGAAVGSARVVYDAEVDGSDGPSELWYVDCSGPAPGPVIRVNHPLDPEWEVASRRVSPSYRWLTYTAWHPRLDEQQWVVDMAKPTPGVPVKVEYPAEAQGLGGLAAYSHDDTMIAFYAGQGSQIHLCTLEPDGGCAAERWDVQFVDGGANDNNQFAFSPDDTRIAWAGDPDADGTQHAFLSGTAPGDAGTAIALTDAMHPGGASVKDIQFSPDGGTLYYRLGVEGRAVDLSLDPPVPAPIPGGDFRDDMTAAVQWVGLDNHGDLSFFTVDGAVAGALVPVHDQPGRVKPNDRAWSPDGRFIVYLADTVDAPERWSLFAVDTSGPAPATPREIAGLAAADGNFESIKFGADPGLLTYFMQPAGGAPLELWSVRLDAPGEPHKLNPPLVDMGSLTGFVNFSPDGSQVLYSAHQDLPNDRELYLVDPTLAGVSTKVSAPLEPMQDVHAIGYFSADGQRVFYNARHSDQQGFFGHYYQVDLDAPGEALMVSDPSHRVILAHVLPPLEP